MKSLFERNHCTNQPRWRWNGCDSWTSCLIDVCVSSCLWPTAGETVLAEGQSGTRAYVWHTLSLTVEVSKGLFFTEQSCTASSVNRLDDRNISVVIQESSCIWWSGSMCFIKASPAPRLSCRVSMRPGCWTDTRCGRTLWCWQQRTAGPPSVHIRLNWPSLITLLWWQNDFFLTVSW